MTRTANTLMFAMALVLSLSSTSFAQTSPQDPDSFLPNTNKSTTNRARTVKDDEGKEISKAARETAQDLYRTAIKYARARLYRQAVQSFEEAVKYDPLFFDAYLKLGHANFDLGDYANAIAAYEKAIALNPDITEAYTAIGQAYIKLKDNGQPSSVGERISLATGSKSEPKASEPEELEQTRIYRVGAGDVLSILLPGSKSDDASQITVSSIGQIEHPLLGRPTNVLGLTTEEISQLFTAELKRRSTRPDPRAEVSVSDYNSHSVIVSGLVKEPGTKILRREAIPLYVVLADAQPLPEAALATVISQRGVKSRTVDIANPQETASLVYPGDVLNVHAAAKQFVYVGGSVKTPGELPFRTGLTLTQAIIAAGGVITKADRAQLTRGRGNDRLSAQEFKLKEIDRGKTPDPLLEPGDRILVLQ